MNKRKFNTALVILLIDQLLKGLVQTFELKYVIIRNIFSIEYTTNTGAAFSLLKNHSTTLLVIGIITLILAYSLSFSYKENKLNDFLFGLLYAGIFGNIIDRALFGYVRDFISIGNFPVFNIADICIVVSIIMLTIVAIKNDVSNKKVSDKNENNSRREHNKN